MFLNSSSENVEIFSVLQNFFNIVESTRVTVFQVRTEQINGRGQQLKQKKCIKVYVCVSSNYDNLTNMGVRRRVMGALAFTPALAKNSFFLDFFNIVCFFLIFRLRVCSCPPPWTGTPMLTNHKFCLSNLTKFYRYITKRQHSLSLKLKLVICPFLWFSIFWG